MKKILVGILLAMMMLTLTACGEPETYESIYEKYSQKIVDATTKYIEKAEKESASLAGNTDALEDLCSDKVIELIEIADDGMSAFIDLTNKEGNQSDEWEYWNNKLRDVLDEQVDRLNDAYWNSGL